ncbi:MAG: ABC transporter substrate-binding protein [Rhodothermales bacterium]
MLALIGCKPSTPIADRSDGWGQVLGTPEANLTSACVEDFDPNIDYFPNKIAPRYAERFRVTYHGHYKVLQANVGGSEWGPDVSDTVVLVQCGTPTPTLEGELAGAAVVQVPIQSMASNEDGSIARADALGYVDRVVGLAGGGIYNATLRQRWEDGELISVGQSFHGAPNFEMLVANRPSVVFLFTSSLDHTEALGQGRDLGLATVPIVGWGEPTILGQAEWIKHTALFLNAEAEANTYFDGVTERYLDLKAQVASLDERPVAIWGGPLSNGGRWWIEAASWAAQAMDDAGGRNPFSADSGETSITISTEAVLEKAEDAQYWLTEHISLETLGAAGPMETIAAFREGRVYHIHKRALPEHDAYDWYETALVRPDVVLQDLVSIFHPDLLPDHELFFLQQIRDES